VTREAKRHGPRKLPENSPRTAKMSGEHRRDSLRIPKKTHVMKISENSQQ